MSKLKILLGSDIKPAYKLPMGSFGLNRALGGGLKGGRIHTFWGPRASGKSTMALFAVAEAQKLGKRCLWVDAEKTFDPEWAERCGVKLDELMVIISLSAESIIECVTPLISKEEVDLVVVDSMSSIAIDSYFSKAESNAIGTGARSHNFLLQKLLYSLTPETQVIIIAHGTMQQGNQKFYLAANISKKAEHWSSTILKFQLGMGKEDTRADNARKVNWKVEKSKQSPYPVTGSYWLQVREEHISVDQVSELATYAIETEVINKKGAWYDYGTYKWHGEAQVTETLKEDKALQEELMKLVSSVEVQAIEDDEDE